MPRKGRSATMIPAVYAYNATFVTKTGAPLPPNWPATGAKLAADAPGADAKNPAIGRRPRDGVTEVTTNRYGPLYTRRTA